MEIPWLMGIITTRSIDTPVLGLKDLMAQHEVRIRNGIKAYALLKRLQAGDNDPAIRKAFNTNKKRSWLWIIVKTLYT